MVIGYRLFLSNANDIQSAGAGAVEYTDRFSAEG